MTDTPPEPKLDELVAEYLVLRNAIQDKEAAHKEEIAVLKEPFDRISSQILDRCNEQNADSIRTPAGTISRKVTTRYWTPPKPQNPIQLKIYSELKTLVKTALAQI